MPTTALPSTPVQTLLTGKYEKLFPAFPSEVTLGDIVGLEEEELLSSIDANKLLLRLFYREYVRPLQTPNPFFGMQYSASNNQPMVMAAVLDLKERVISDRFSSVNKRLIPSSQLETTMTLQYGKTTLDQIEFVDLSNNNLLDSDLPFIERFVTNCLPNCTILRLSGNRIVGDAQSIAALKVLLSQPSISYVDITGNALAALSQIEFFTQLQPHFNKLIWIPKRWLEHTSWHAMVASADVTTVVDAHEAFFAKFY